MSVDESPRTGQPEREPGDERWYLTDEREFLQRSLSDADREREAGDLSSEDHALLVARDTARLADVEDELAALDVASTASSTSVRPRAPGAPRAPGDHSRRNPSPRPCHCGASSALWGRAC